MKTAKALTIAGSDSGGGAGIQADLKTFQELNAYGTSVITALTAQNTLGVHGVYPQSAACVGAQLDAVLADIGADAVKTGMLFSAEIITLAADKLEQYGVQQLVVDPVMIAKGGAPLLQPEAVQALKERLLPLASLVTPNIPEACHLLGVDRLTEPEELREASRRLLELGAKAVLLKGGHLEGTRQWICFTTAMPSSSWRTLASGRRTHTALAVRYRPQSQPNWPKEPR